MSNTLVLKQIRAEGGCNSFILADANSRKALIIDPRADEIDQYEEFLGANELKAEMVIDTHTHADHYSGSHFFAERFGSHIAMSVATKSARPDLKLTDGHTLDFGLELGVRILLTPGHTPDSLSVLASGGWGQAVFTGDTLFIGESGRVDFPGASAESQYDSIHTRLATLPDATWVMPGHDYSGLLFSTIGEEKRSNSHMRITDKSEFVKVKKAELIDAPSILSQILDFNLAKKPASRPRSGAHTMCASSCQRPVEGIELNSVSQYRDALVRSLAAGWLFVDVREPDEFARGHIPGTQNIPLSELPLHWNALKRAPGVYFSCQAGGRSQLAAQSTKRLGLASVVNVTGGFGAWVAAGFPVER